MDAGELLQLATELHGQGQLAQAEALYGQVLDAQPGNFEARHRLAVVSIQRGDFDEALQRVEAALQVDARSIKALSNKGSILLAMQRADEALACYDAALQIDPGDPDAHYNRANVLMLLGRHGAAADSWEKSAALRPGDVAALANLATVLMRLSRNAEALVVLERAIAIAPEAAALHVSRGNVLMGLRRTEGALASFDRALGVDTQDIDAPNIEALCGRTLALIELGRLREALEAYDRAAALAPGAVQLAHISRDDLVA
jgi:tetratricopeptide (TPR) repeat protein